MNICLTGANGFIGLNLVKKLLALDIHLKIILRQDSNAYKITSLAGNNPKCTFCVASRGYNGLFSPGDVVIHLAGLQAGKDVPDEEYDAINYGIAANIISSCPDGIRLFVFLSTVRVYGDHNDERISETTHYGGRSRYAISKIKVENLLETSNRSSGFPFCILQPSFVYGPGDANGLMSKLLRITRYGIAPVINSGRNKLNFIYIDDLVEVMERIILAPEVVLNKKFIIGFPKDESLLDIYSKIAKISRRRLHLIRISPFLSNVLTKAGLVTSSQVQTLGASIRIGSMKIYEALGMQPRIDMDMGLKSMFIESQNEQMVPHAN